jgi:glutathione peroxidase-family protein
MSTMYDLTMKSITGEGVNLADYRGKVSLIVNVATN